MINRISHARLTSTSACPGANITEIKLYVIPSSHTRLASPEVVDRGSSGAKILQTKNCITSMYRIYGNGAKLLFRGGLASSNIQNYISITLLFLNELCVWPHTNPVDTRKCDINSQEQHNTIKGTYHKFQITYQNVFTVYVSYLR